MKRRATAILLAVVALASLYSAAAHGTFTNTSAQNALIHAPDATTTAARAIPDISKTPPSQIAERDKLIALFKPDDPSSIFTIVDTIAANPALSFDCHEIAHDLGHKAYELYGFAGAMNFTDTKRLDKPSVQDICAGGYVHGVLEEAALYQPSFVDNPGEMCAQAPQGSRASCFHGVGHALMFANYRDVHASVIECRKAGTSDEASRCFEGVYMELFWGSTKYSGPDTLGWDPAKPFEPCIETGADAKFACFLYSSFGYLRNHAHDYTGAISLCTQSKLIAQDEQYCLRGVGITMVSHFKAAHLEQSESFVAGLPAEDRYAFYKGVFGYGALVGVSSSTLAGTCAGFNQDADLCRAILEENSAE